MNESESHEPSSGGDKDSQENIPAVFNPETLDRTLISLELIAEMQKSGDSVALDVIIDLNLEFPSGRDAAQRWVAEWLEKHVTMSMPVTPESSQDSASVDPRSRKLNRESINKAKSKYSQQYLFASLTPATIRQLAADSRAKAGGSFNVPTADPMVPSKPTGKEGRGKSPVYKIWFDHDLKHFANVSIVTVKADAARAAFSADGRDIVWAIADSGIDGSHPHFALHGNLAHLPAPLRHRDFTGDGSLSEAKLDAAARQDKFGHGTHVAGIIAGEIEEKAYESAPAKNSKSRKKKHPELTTETAPAVAFRRERDERENITTQAEPLARISGMAPRCKLLSLKVLDENGEGKASNLIAAIDYIQHLNGNGRRIRIHGVNISVGYSYKPEWFACGQSPLCVEIDRLVKSGVCVVVAVGNDGYGYVKSANAASASAGLDVTIADPGNAELAITVGSTHREMPHTYGVSYFSSKGPTGDGRLKPDILAPGEKIISCMSAQMTDRAREETKLSKETIDNTIAKARKDVALYREESGTSMAAPHVSGVIAAFLSNRREFIGRPEAVKDIFLTTATDLKRAVYFQGKGLVDLMRAIQSV